jgi:hypothetical protein
VTLSPKDLKNKIDKQEAKKKLDEERIKKVLEQEKYFRATKQISDQKNQKKFIVEVIRPIFEAAIEGKNQAYFIDLDKKISSQLNEAGFSVDDWDFYSAEDAASFDQSLISRYGIDPEREWLEFDQLIDDLANILQNEIPEIEMNVAYSSEEELQLLEKVKNLNFSSSQSLRYKMDKVDQLNELVEVFEDIKPNLIPSLSKGFKTIIKKLPAIREAIDIADGVSGKYFLTEVSWSLYSDEESPDVEFGFFNGSVAHWVSNEGNLIFKQIFTCIEESIKKNKEICTFDLIQYGSIVSFGEPNQLWLDDKPLKISLSFFIDIFESLGYLVRLIDSKEDSEDFEDSVKTCSIELKWTLS